MQNKALIVIGMHRSGTSALSGLLDELGIFMGKTLFAAQKGVNEKGFFENAELVALNDLMLDELASSWDDPIADIGDYSIGKESFFIEKAHSLLKEDYDDQAFWGMKDPRTTLLLPFWKKVLKENEKVLPHYILMLRSPFEVFGSLKKRDDFSLEKSLMLWMNYTLSGYYHSMHAPRLIVHYDKLLSSPESVAKNIAALIDKPFDIAASPLSFVDKKMRNQRTEPTLETPLAVMAQSLYEQLSKDKVDEAEVDKIRNDYLSYQSSLSIVLKEHLLAVKKEEVFYRKLFVDAYNSFWWKCSWPIKKVEELIRGKK